MFNPGFGGLGIGGGMGGFGQGMQISSAAFSPSGKNLALGSGDTIHLWDLARGREIRRFGEEQAAADTAVFSPDGTLLATGSADGVVCLWEVASGTFLGRFKGHRGAVGAVAFSADGKALASGGADTAAVVWDVPCLIRRGREEARNLSPEKRAQLWNDLAGDDAARADQAIWALAGAPNHAVHLLHKRLQRVAPVDPKQVARLVADLDSRDFAVRRQASADLEKLGDLAEPALAEVLAGQPSLEVRQRVDKLLEKAHGPVRVPEQIRALRALEVLELIGSAEARQLLEQLGQGAAEARVTQEAKAAVQRLAARAAGP
jgi:hypothetical protein